MTAHRSKEEWANLISEQRASGESQARFCESRGLSLGAFQYQLKKSREDDFVELSLPCSADPKNQERVEAQLELPGGAVLRFTW